MVPYANRAQHVHLPRAHPEVDMTLEELRAEIDVLDLKIVDLLSERARYVVQIGQIKAQIDAPVYEPNREKTIYTRLREANKGPLPDIELAHIYERIIDVMRALQKHELASERNARLAAGQATGAGVTPGAPETGKKQ
jgi:chorismate mutase-like protein